MKLLFAVVAVYFSLFATTPACTQSYVSLGTFSEDRADFTTVPAILHQSQGKYPDAHVVLLSRGCRIKDGKGDHPLPTSALVIELSGSASATNAKRDDDCSVSFDVHDPATDHDTLLVHVKFAGDGARTAFLQLADPLAGPTPAAPEVDILWAPIGGDVCNKAFSRPVSKYFYCIAVKIGNNSGYQLQIAGVGFKTPFAMPNKTCDDLSDKTRCRFIKTPNTSYALTRAVAQEADGFTLRSATLHGIEAAGLLMTSATPFFHNERSSSRFATAASIVSGPLVAAFNALFPDQSLRQANNLDDQSLRDGKLIPNNTQLTTVVFLDKDSVTLDFKAACDRLYGSYEARAPAAADQRAKGFALQDAKTNSGEIRSISRHASELYDQCVRGESSSGIKEALGELVLVGDEVEFKQRIVVDQTVHSQEAAASARPLGVTLTCRTLGITGSNLTSLPMSLLINTSSETQSAQMVESASTAESAVYHLDHAFLDGTAFYLPPIGSALPIELRGNVKNTTPKPESASLNGTTMVVSGGQLGCMPKTLSVHAETSDITAVLSGTMTDTSASYTLASTPDAGKKITIENQTAMKLTRAISVQQ